MAIHFTFCKPRIEDIKWRILFKYYGEDESIDDMLEKFFREHDELGTLQSKINKIKSFQDIFRVKLLTEDPDWFKKVSIGNLTWITFYAQDLEIDLLGETKDQREYALGFSAMNFHRFFNDYLNMNISESGSVNPQFFLNAIRSAPPPFFGSTPEQEETTLTEPESGMQFSSKFFNINEDYIASRKLKLEEICLEAIKRNDNICWR
jgi:hypothetical protein